MRSGRVLLLVAVGLMAVSAAAARGDATLNNPVANEPGVASVRASATALPTAERAPTGQGQGTLLVWSDGLCRVVVDGQVVGTLAGGEWLRVPVGLGDHVLRAEGLEDAAVVDVRRLHVGSEPVDVRLSVAGRQRPPGAPAIQTASDQVFGPEERVNSRDGLAYAWIPPGTFQMGCVPGDSECYSGESPRHSVTLSRGFWMGKTEVTGAAWARYGSLPSCSYQYGGSYPVICATWDEAQAFCAWGGGRLPTEAQWEYAARGGVEGEIYPWTGGASHDMANYYGTGGRDVWDSPSAVASFPANRHWLYDMAGNEWEWVSDWYGDYSSSSATDPTGPGSGPYRVRRGGSWDYDPRELRASNRGLSSPWDRVDVIGFRCVRDALP